MLTSFAHVRKSANKSLSGGFTVAFRLGEDRDKAVRAVTYAYARCNKKDQFVKKTGRELALQRLAETNGTVCTTTAKRYNGILRAVIRAVERDIEADLKKINVKPEEVVDNQG